MFVLHSGDVCLRDYCMWHDCTFLAEILKISTLINCSKEEAYNKLDSY